jgi:hypothetical protein
VYYFKDIYYNTWALSKHRVMHKSLPTKHKKRKPREWKGNIIPAIYLLKVNKNKDITQ